MMIERRILESLDACRPGSDDLNNPDHAELAEAASLAKEDPSVQAAYQRVRQLDQEIEAAFEEEIPLPEGLSARLKLRLDEATQAAPAETPAPVSLPIEDHPTRRRWLWGAAACVAAVILVVLGINLKPQDPTPLSRENLRNLSKDWHASVQEQKWEKNLGLAPADLPFPAHQIMGQARGFQLVADQGNRPAVAYDVSFGRHKATVIVYKAQATGLDLVPPQTPFNTQGVCVGVWHHNGLLFALVVEGNPSHYRQLLPSNQGNLG